MNTILVAGGAGFIGSHVCQRFLQEGNNVLCVDNLLTGSDKNINKFQDNPNFRFINHDVVQPFPHVPNELSAVCHLASPASPNAKSPRSYISFPVETLMANSQGTKNLLELAKEKNAKFLFASTSEVYGDPDRSPQKEDYWGNVNPNGVRSVYDESKRFGEAMTMAYYRKFHVDTRIVRIFNTYGERMQKDDGRVVSNFISQALVNKPLTVYGKGQQTRSFCYISDMVEGLVNLVVKDGIAGEVVNIGNPDEYSILDIAEKIKLLTSSSSEVVFEELPPDDPKQRKPDIARVKELLGWEPKVTLEDGLKKTIEYFSDSVL